MFIVMKYSRKCFILLRSAQERSGVKFLNECGPQQSTSKMLRREDFFNLYLPNFSIAGSFPWSEININPHQSQRNSVTNNLQFFLKFQKLHMRNEFALKKDGKISNSDKSKCRSSSTANVR